MDFIYPAGTHSTFMLSNYFISSTIKIQNNKEALLSPEEKNACSCGLIQGTTKDSEAPTSPVRSPVCKKFRAKLEQKIKAKSATSSEQRATQYCEGMHLCVTATNAVGEQWNSMADATLSK